jgi:hypothetical protein
MRSAILFMLCGGTALAGPGLLPDGKLDMPSLQASYKEGRHEQVKEVLEEYLKEKGEAAGKGELVFIFKYLGAIYAANPNERPRADSYFSQLLTLVPDVELTETFTSGKVQEIFAESKKDFLRAQEYNATHDAFGNPIPDKRKPLASEPKESGGHAWIWWTAGLAAVAGGAGAAYFALQSPDPAPLPRHFTGGF